MRVAALPKWNVRDKEAGMRGSQFRRINWHQFLTAVGAILSVVVSVCAAKSAAPAATSPAPTPPEATTPVPRPPGWQEYATPILIPASGISKLAIDYAWEGWGERQLAWTVTKTGDKYRTEQGESVEAALVVALGSSLTNLRRSGGLKSCLNHTDDYPHFRIVILFEDGSEVTLLSDSNCPQNVPWNVVHEDDLYVQYTGEIPAALRALLGSLVDDPEEKDLIDAQPDWLGFAFSIVGGELPAGVKGTGFSEKELYLQILTESALFAPFVPAYEVGDLKLFCSPDADNRDCSAIDGTVTLESRGGGVVFLMPARFQGLAVSEIAFGAKELEDIGRRISEHVLAQSVKDLAPGVTLRISCSSVSRCNEGSHYPAVYASLGLAAPPECSPCSIRFDGWDVHHEFVYFPDLERIWVDHLQYGVDRFQANRSALGLDHPLTFYRSPGYETLVDEHIIDLKIQTCDRMMVSYEPGVLEANPEYVSSLGENALNYANRIDVSGYCVFVNAQGEAEVKKHDR